MSKYFPKYLLRKSRALTLSLICHALIFVTISNIHLARHQKPKSGRLIPVTFVEEKMVSYDKNANLKELRRQDNSSISDVIISNTSATSGYAMNVTGNTTAQYKKSLIASLEEMEELVSRFNFRGQTSPRDSIGAFSPVQGSAPDTESLSQDLSNGILEVAGFGRSKCKQQKGGL